MQHARDDLAGDEAVVVVERASTLPESAFGRVGQGHARRPRDAAEHAADQPPEPRWDHDLIFAHNVQETERS
jgi:hypothetical protein